MDLHVDDHSRVKLLENPGVPGSDYINANFLDVSKFKGMLPLLFYIVVYALGI